MTSTLQQQGWVQSIDPNSGRIFYANHITRKTQWEPPDGWEEQQPPLQSQQPQPTTSLSNGGYHHHHHNDHDDTSTPLPSNWEMMHDPTTGKPFYVDHTRKITQWTRPTMEQQLPASTTTSTTTAKAIPLYGSSSNHSNNLYSSNKSNHNTIHTDHNHEYSYYTQPILSSSNQQHVDLSDTLPPLEFKVETVSDILRPTCSHCNVIFSLSKRRHHCRLCGDIFCDPCSTRRCILPLPGIEYEKPVRVCNYCYTDVEQGNFFSMRRYLTVLHLYEPGMDEISGSVATIANVNAALSSLTQDLDQMVSSADQVSEKVTIPAETLIPEIIKHLESNETSDRAIRCIASLLSLESLGTTMDYAVAIYLYGQKHAMDYILSILERHGSNRKTLFVQEQAARTLYYLTESKLIGAVTRKRSELVSSKSNDNTKEHDNDDDSSYGTVEDSLDIPRAIRNMLDHASSATTGNPNLQRWAAATLKNLIVEDQRRSCDAVNEMAAFVASGETIPSNYSTTQYTSHLPELISTGGVMILGSLIGSDDPDTRAHAITALGATIHSTRSVDAALLSLSEMSGGEYGQRHHNDDKNKDGTIIRAIVAAGGCSSSVAQLLLSAEHGVAGMGCQFLSSLVKPLFVDTIYSEPLSSQYEYDRDASNMGAYREAAIEILTGSCLPALLSLIRESRGTSSKSQRPLEIRFIAMETLCISVWSVCDMGRAWAVGQYEEGLERFGAPSKLKEAIIAINEEGVLDCALDILQSSAFGQSLGTVSNKETLAARIRECAGIIISSITSCSAEAITNLQSRNVLSSLLLASTDSTMTLGSTMRADGSPRCLGVLETVSSLLLFSWQHPSGSDKPLLDTLIEMVDAGAIPYLSKVLRAKVEWESKDKAIGGMKARSAGCRFLCCLFGIALTDPTGIGMRRLMDAVESDASLIRQSEQQSSRRSSNPKRVPTNIVEVALGTLQTASNLARVALLGGEAAYQQGPYYHSSVMDLVESSLLAVGSMCGSSIAPGGSEGTLVTGESFLEQRSDSYVSRRQEICNVACDVVVRGGRGEPTLLPTMVVGGFGEGSILASLRLALAIAQNGTKEQHTKLASSGILVPISDLLRTALSRGDIYKFSSSLALVRFCGPYVAAGQGGGLESVRDAIRVATNVLTLPVNPTATKKQMDTQEALKSECISALEALSRNASLWSSISSEALPAIVKYLHSSASATGSMHENPREQVTKSAALRAVLQIVQVPSHAVSAAESGIVSPLGQLLSTSTDESEIALLSMKVLHIIATNQQARSKANFLQSGILRPICSIIGGSTSEAALPSTNGSENVVFLGIEILHSIHVDIEGENPIESLLQSPTVATFLAVVTSEPQFTRALCATMLYKTNMKLPRHDITSDEVEFDIPYLYGRPLNDFNEKCAGYNSFHDAAGALLFSLAVYSCALATEGNDAFWNVALLKNSSGSMNQNERHRTSATFSAYFLTLLSDDHKSFIPINKRRHEDFLTITRPLVRHRLLESLRDSMSELYTKKSSKSSTDPYLISVLVGFNVPHICLSLWRDPALLDLAFDVIKEIADQDRDEILHLFVEEKSTIMSLFDLLNLDSSFDSSTDITNIRQFLASTLGHLAESGLLADAVQKFDVRSSAISALATACISEEVSTPDEDDDMTSNQLSSVLMRCLVELCTVKGSDGSNRSIRLAPAEAMAIATNLGKKLCHMVLTRFLERTKLKQYEMDEDENILTAPDVAMLCAVAQHVDALQILRSIGGLHALSLVAAEGEVSALEALKKACIGDSDVLLEGETYLALMDLVSSVEHDDIRTKASSAWRQLESMSFDLLANLAVGSNKGRVAVATARSFEDCVLRAINIVQSFADGNSESDMNIPSFTSVEETETIKAEEVEERNNTKLVESKQEPECDDISLGVAANSFLASVSSAKFTYTSLGDDVKTVNALSNLLVSSCSEDLKFAALKTVVAHAPFASCDGMLNINKVGELLISVLVTKTKVSTKNVSEMEYFAICGLDTVFDQLELSEQEKAFSCIVTSFQQSVKSCIVSRFDGLSTAKLSYAVTCAILSRRGKDCFIKFVTKDVVTSFVHMIQWRYDPKTIFNKSEARAWDASVANCLLLVASLIWRPNEIMIEQNIDIDALRQTTLMLARPGKAPRKAIDVITALTYAIDGADASSSLAAERIRSRMFM